MINYGNEVIYDGRKALDSFVKYASNADPVNLQPPSSQQMAQGVAPLNTLPAPWFNVFHQRYTVNFQMASQVVYDLYAELLSVLADGSVTPSITTQNQLRDAIRNIVDTRMAIVSDKVVEFTPATSAQALTSGDTLAVLMGKLAYWRTEYTSNLNTHKAVEATYSAKGHVQIDPTGGLSVTDGILDLKAASASANGYMSSTDKTRLDNVYQGVLNVTKATDNQTINISYANGKAASSINFAEATTSLRGLMSSTDKTRLDNVYQAGTSLSLSGSTLTLNKANGGTASSVTLVTMIPDYANMESVNRISINGNTWTADRNGFVLVAFLSIWTDMSAGCYINNVHMSYLSGGMWPSYMSVLKTELFEVKMNDIIKVVSQLSTSFQIPTPACYYIPPRIITLTQ